MEIIAYIYYSINNIVIKSKISKLELILAIRL
jgi:hypothetical protein